MYCSKLDYLPQHARSRLRRSALLPRARKRAPAAIAVVLVLCVVCAWAFWPGPFGRIFVATGGAGQAGGDAGSFVGGSPSSRLGSRSRAYAESSLAQFAQCSDNAVQSARSAPGDARLAPADSVFAGVWDGDGSRRFFDFNTGSRFAPASVFKLFTATVSIRILGADARFATSVYPAGRPGAVVLVGGGDPTLRQSGVSVYGSSAPSIVQLANLLKNNLAHEHNFNNSKMVGISVREVFVDASYFAPHSVRDQVPQGSERFGAGADPTHAEDALGRYAYWDSKWPESDRLNGYISPISALTLDGGRVAPGVQYATRVEDPASFAGRRFASLLGGSFVGGYTSWDKDQQPLAQVYSPTVLEMVSLMLQESDNVLAENLLRLAAIKAGFEPDINGMRAIFAKVLGQLGLDPLNVHLGDASGLSDDNYINIESLLKLLGAVRADAQLAGIVDLLPKSHVSGTLKKRFANLPSAAIVAKTGTLDNLRALAGFFDFEGHRIRFAVAIERTNGQRIASEGALDYLVSKIWSCANVLHS